MLSRRKILLGGAAALTTAATAAPVAWKAAEVRTAVAGPARQEANADLAILRLVREIRRCRECGHALDRARDLESAMLDLPAGTLVGVLAKFYGWYGDDELAVIREGKDQRLDSLPADYHSSIFLDLERLSGGLRL